MTDREKAIVTAYTGYAMLAEDKLDTFYAYVQEKLGRPFPTNGLDYSVVFDEIREASREDFIALGKEDGEPRVLTLEELKEYISLPPVFVDDLGAQEDYIQDIAPLYMDFPNPETWYVHWRDVHTLRQNVDCAGQVYGKRWRVWTAKPTNEQMERTKWDE